MQRRGDPAVEVPEGAHALQRTEALQGGQAFRLALLAEQPLLVLHVGQHGLHEVRLVDPGKAQADAVGALVQAERHRHRDAAEQRAVPSGFAQVLEQHVAAQRIADRVQRRLRAPGAQVRDHLGEVVADPGMVAARQAVRLPRATAPVQRHAGPAALQQGALQTEDVVRRG